MSLLYNASVGNLALFLIAATLKAHALFMILSRSQLGSFKSTINASLLYTLSASALILALFPLIFQTLITS